MISEIKQRITQLNNGEIPNGYKKTEFGIFPCDWVADKRVKDIGTFGKGKGLPGEKMISEGVPCVGYGDIYMKYNNFHFEKAESFVDEETASESQPIQKGTLLFTGTGETAEEIGKCVCYNGDETIYAGGDIITFTSNEVNPLFLAYQQYQDFSLRNKASFGQGHSVVHIRQNNLEKLHVAYPKSTDEQSKIAEILMKWDEAIELQKQYITKIILRNGAVVDKLLSSKDNWRPLPLSTFVELKNGYAFKSEKYINEGKYKIITIKNVKSGEFDLTECCTIDELPNNLQTHQLLSMGDIIISLTGNVGRACIVNAENCLLNQRVGKIVVKTISPVFVYEILQTNRFVSKMKNIAQGCAQANLSNADVEDFLAFFPYDGDSLDIKTIDKISCILSEFRNELALQKELLNKLLLQRKALQQYLLNGIVRVEV